VTTVPFSHATAAAFFSHQLDRVLYHAIADEMVSRTRPDVIIGGGHPGFGQAFQFLSADTYDELRSAPDWVYVERRRGHLAGAALLAAADLAVDQRRGLFGLFGGDDGGFEPQRPVNSPGSPRFAPGSVENPTTAEAVEAALEVLAAIDWANHRNDFGWMIGAMASLDEAVRATTSFVDRPGDSVDWQNTLLIVTSDHGNGYLRLSPDQPLGQGELPDDWPTYATYSTGDHTNELVMVYAKGGGLSDTDRGPFAAVEGAFYEGLRLIDNTHLYSVMAEFLGVDAR
jgi:alkaline phosphatase